MKHLWNGGINVYINYLVHMTKMAAMPIYGKNPSKIFFSESGGPISKKLGMNHEKKMDLRAHMPTPWGNIHVYYHNIQTSSPLKPLGQLKPNFM